MHVEKWTYEDKVKDHWDNTLSTLYLCIQTLCKVLALIKRPCSLCKVFLGLVCTEKYEQIHTKHQVS